MNKNLPVSDLTPVVAELIKSGTDVRLTVTGNSMFPMIRSLRDSVVITKAPAVLKKYDIPLVQRENGDYVLHRIIRIKSGEYYLNGDNQYFVEKGIKNSQVIGVVKSFTRRGREFNCENPIYKIYTRFWVFIKPFRGIVNWVYLKTVAKLKRRLK